MATACSGDAGGDEPSLDEPGNSQGSEGQTTEPTIEPTTEEPTDEVPDELRVIGDSYSYAIPKGWEDIIENPEADGADTFVRSTTSVGGFAANLNTVIAAGSGTGALTADTPHLRQLRKEFARSNREQTGVLPRPIADTELDGSFTIGHTVDEYGGRGTMLTMTQYATVRDDVSHVITLTAATADAEHADAALSTVMESWTWK